MKANYLIRFHFILLINVVIVTANKPPENGFFAQLLRYLNIDNVDDGEFINLFFFIYSTVIVRLFYGRVDLMLNPCLIQFYGLISRLKMTTQRTT